MHYKNHSVKKTSTGQSNGRLIALWLPYEKTVEEPLELNNFPRTIIITDCNKKQEVMRCVLLTLTSVRSAQVSTVEGFHSVVTSSSLSFTSTALTATTSTAQVQSAGCSRRRCCWPSTWHVTMTQERRGQYSQAAASFKPGPQRNLSTAS